MNGTYGTTTALQVGTAPKLLDEYMRRELRVGNPRNALEVVTALRQRYRTDAARLDQEAAGLPVRYTAQPIAPLSTVARTDTPGSQEQARVQADLESDLAAIIDSRNNREWAPESRGWRDVLLREFAEGAGAARFAQDPARRDRATLCVRKLSEYARIARLVGAINLPLICDYRRLATTLDAAADVIRILMGEALYVAGVADGGIIIQVPVLDLRQRRDSLVLAVRRMSGTLESNGADGDWGDGMAAYGRLLQELDARGAPELTVYLREEQLVVVVDSLVGSISRQDPEALRQVAAVAPVEIARLRRLAFIAGPLADPNIINVPPNPTAPALSFFVQSLQLFVDAFATLRGGARLIDLAVPLPMASRQADEADRVSRRILREVVSLRGDLVAEIECLLSCCGCDTEQLTLQVQLDKVLFDVDKAIDLFAQGVSYPPDWGYDTSRAGVFSEEQRASVYSLVIDNLLGSLPADFPRTVLKNTLEAISDELDDALPPVGPLRNQLVDDVFAEQFRAEADWEQLVQSLAPRCLDAGRVDLVRAGRALLNRIGPANTPRSLFVAPLPPPPLRVGVRQIAEGVSGYGIGTTDSTMRDAVHFAQNAGAFDELRQVITDWVQKRQQTGNVAPTVDPALKDLVKDLNDLQTTGEFQAAVNRPEIRERWRKVKTSYATVTPNVPDELTALLDPWLDTSAPVTVSVPEWNRARKIFKKYLAS